MRNCREVCGYKSLCEQMYKNFKGEEGLQRDDCPMAWKIEDILMDAEAVRKEQEREEEIPFSDPEEIPEEEEERL